MATHVLSNYTVTTEKRQDFLSLLREGRAFWEAAGAVVRIRTLLSAGENSGRISVSFLYPDVMARAVSLDKAGADAANNPMLSAQARGTFPASLVGRSWVNSLEPTAPIPADTPVLTVNVWEVTPGRLADARAALAASDKRFREAGAEPTLWTLGNAGTATGRLVRTIGYGSYVAHAEFLAKIAQVNAAMEAPAPIAAATASGILRSVSASLTTRLAGV